MLGNPLIWFRDQIRSEYLIVDRSSWHYRLVKYVYDDDFFYKDAYKLRIKYGVIEQIKEQSDPEVIKILQQQVDEGKYDPEIPRTVTLCTYFWATVLAVALSGWILWLFRHAPKHKERHIKYRPLSPWKRYGISMSIWVGLGIMNSYYGSQWAIMDFIIAGAIAAMIWQRKHVFAGLDVLAKWWERNAPKLPPINIEKPKSLGAVGMVFAMIKAEKNKYCPRLDFLDRHEYKAPDRDIEP